MSKITGYRELSPREIELINSSKAIGDEVGRFVKGIQTAAIVEPGLEIDAKFLALAKTYLQLGFMALTRSIAKPEHF